MCAREEVGREEDGQIKGREGWTETKRRGPATCRQFLIRLRCAPHNEDQMREGRKKKKKFPAAYFFSLLREWGCSCLRPVDDPARTRCSGDASQWGQEQTDENRFSRLIRKFTFPSRLSTAQSWSCWSTNLTHGAPKRSRRGSDNVVLSFKHTCFYS